MVALTSVEGFRVFASGGIVPQRDATGEGSSRQAPVREVRDEADDQGRRSGEHYSAGAYLQRLQKLMLGMLTRLTPMSDDAVAAA